MFVISFFSLTAQVTFTCFLWDLWRISPHNKMAAEGTHVLSLKHERLSPPPRCTPCSRPVAPHAERPNPDTVSVFAAARGPLSSATCLPCRLRVQLQDRAREEHRRRRRETRGGGGTWRSGVYPQKKGEEPHDEDWLRLVSLFSLVHPEGLI